VRQHLLIRSPTEVLLRSRRDREVESLSGIGGRGCGEDPPLEGHLTPVTLHPPGLDRASPQDRPELNALGGLAERGVLSDGLRLLAVEQSRSGEAAQQEAGWSHEEPKTRLRRGSHIEG
jgi:hypothetical protein